VHRLSEILIWAWVAAIFGAYLVQFKDYAIPVGRMVMRLIS